jgi:ferredoxin-NADP reductase
MAPLTRLHENADAALGADADGFSPLRIKEVVRETVDAVSLVLDVPTSSERQFRYQAGQFLTLRVLVNGHEHRRCYSMSSSPALEQDLRITIKRDRNGVVSNFLNDSVVAGDEVHATRPDGRFILTDNDRSVVAFAGGSGITPVFSIIRSALASTSRRAHLFYANRNAESVIFNDQLAALEDANRDRFRLHHHLDAHAGVASARDIAEFINGAEDADYYICGPGPFMNTVETALSDVGVARQRVHLERFTFPDVPLPFGWVVPPAVARPTGPLLTEAVTIELDGRTTVVAYRAGNTVLQTARQAGLKAPFSCETGSCGTCMARVIEGSVHMLNNDALEDEEVAEGWVVTCQSLPTSRTVRVVYE